MNMTKRPELLSDRLKCHLTKQEHKIIHPIKDIVPSGTMPQAITQPDREQTHCRNPKSCHVLSIMLFPEFVPLFYQRRDGYRIKDIGFKPFTQRNMPASPELGCTLGKNGCRKFSGNTIPNSFPLPIIMSIQPENSM